MLLLSLPAKISLAGLGHRIQDVGRGHLVPTPELRTRSPAGCLTEVWVTQAMRKYLRPGAVAPRRRLLDKDPLHVSSFAVCHRVRRLTRHVSLARFQRPYELALLGDVTRECKCRRNLQQADRNKVPMVRA